LIEYEEYPWSDADVIGNRDAVESFEMVRSIRTRKCRSSTTYIRPLAELKINPEQRKF
jgi:hypothetical protein